MIRFPRVPRPRCLRCDVVIARAGYCYTCANQRRREIAAEQASERLRTLQAARAERSRRRKDRTEAERKAVRAGRPIDADIDAMAGQMVRLDTGEILTSMDQVRDPELTRRRTTCRRQSACVSEAMKRRWAAFSCDACPVRDPMSREEQVDDLVGLAGLLRAIDLPRAIAEEIS